MLNCYCSFSLSGPLYVVVEFAPNGNLRQFLKERRPTREIPTSLTALRDRWPVRENSSTLTYMDLVSFSYQVCRGMEYLSSKKVCVKMWYFSDDCRNKWASCSHHALREISDLVEFGLKTKVVSKMGVLGQFLYILLIYALFELDLGHPVWTGFGRFRTVLILLIYALFGL